MLQNILKLPDGSSVTSGANQNPALLKVNLTQTVNAQKELTAGTVCSQMLEASIYAPDGLDLAAGQQVSLYTYDGKNQTLAGKFRLEKPTRKAGVYRLVAYDVISLLDKDLTAWLACLTGWPYSLQTFTQMVFTQCGIPFVTESMPNGDLPVEKFAARSVTGRQLISWAAECAGRFCRATADGKGEFAWYTTGIAIHAGTTAFYYQGSLTREDYNVSPITAVQIRREASDVGTCYPAAQTGANAYIVEGNPLLTASSAQSLQKAAQNLYAILSPITYNPCTFTVPASLNIQAGQILTVDGRQVYVMKRQRNGSRDTLSCTGSKTRAATGARNQLTTQALSGKVLNLQTDVDGIRAENTDTAGKVSSLALSLDGFKTQVQNTYATNDALTQHKNAVSTQFTQTENSFQMKVDAVSQKVEDVDTDLQDKYKEQSEKISSLEVSSESFKTQVQNTYVSNEALGAYKNTLSTQFAQTEKDFQMKFESTSQAIGEVNQDLQDKYNERTSYIRFEEGNIILGRSGSDITLVQSNDRISFYQNGNEVAYIADDNLYITQGEFMKELRIGKFGFTPGANGNLSFKKVVD